MINYAQIKEFTMFKNYLFLLILIPIYGWSQTPVDLKSLTQVDDIYCQTQSTIPYTGIVYSLYPDGNLLLEGRIENGKWGNSIMYYKNGQKQFENSYKNGVRHGVQLWWHENGQLKSSQSYKNNILDGVSKSWWPDGRTMDEYLYVNGIIQNR